MVPNVHANLLCRFIAGKATADEVKVVASELVKHDLEVSALRLLLAQAKQLADTTETARAGLWGQLYVAQHKLEEFGQMAAEREVVAMRNKQTISELLKILESARKMAEVSIRQSWWKKTPRKNLDALAVFLWSEGLQKSIDIARGTVQEK